MRTRRPAALHKGNSRGCREVAAKNRWIGPRPIDRRPPQPAHPSHLKPQRPGAETNCPSTPLNNHVRRKPVPRTTILLAGPYCRDSRWRMRDWSRPGPPREKGRVSRIRSSADEPLEPSRREGEVPSPDPYPPRTRRKEGRRREALQRVLGRKNGDPQPETARSGTARRNEQRPEGRALRNWRRASPARRDRVAQVSLRRLP